MPDTKTKIAQQEDINNVCPISGCITSNKETLNATNKDIKYLILKFSWYLLHNIKDTITTKNGFNNSTGWNLGNKIKSSHLFDPLTSTPITGTNINSTIEIQNINIENWYNLFLSIEDKNKIIDKPKIINIECLKKNVKSFVLSLFEATREVETKEKNKPVINNIIIIEKIGLSKFFHQL